MKHAIRILFVLATVGFIMTTPVIAATSQGFEWGFKEDDQFNFTLTANSENVSVSEEFYLIVKTIPLIPNVMSAWNDIPFINFDGYWKNGTSMGMNVLYLLFVEKIAVPIGNYSLLSEFVNDILDHESTDSSLYWGFTNEFNLPSGRAEISVDYLKEDGFLAHYFVSFYNGTTIVGEYSAVRLGLPSTNILGLIQDNILLIGAGVVVVGAVYCLVARKR